MKVILQKDVPHLGEAGDIKEVTGGFARNYLLPKGLVIVYNESSAKAIEHQKKLVKIKKEKRKKEGQKLVDALSNITLTIGAQVGEEDKLFGSVTAIDIAEKLSQMGHVIDKRKIVLSEPIKKAGEHIVKIKLEEGMSASITVAVVKE